MESSSDQQQITRIGNYTSEFRAKKDSIGSGGYGTVYVGHQIGNNKNKVAIKIIKLEMIQISQTKSIPNLSAVLNEIKSMVNLTSQGTIKILATDYIKFGQKDQDSFAIVMEKMDGNLRDLLKKKKKLTENQAIDWASKIIECYKHLHKAKVIHRDLKPANVLYRKKGEQLIFKIGDFGISRNAKACKTMTNIGSRFYTSPQQTNQGKYTDKTDVYAFGCILFEFLVGSDKVPSEVSGILNSGKINKEETEKFLGGLGVSKIMIQLIQGCLKYEESQRLAWKNIFNHPIFKKGVQKIQLKRQIKITPDRTTYAWKQNQYMQDNQSNNVCIYQGGDGHSQWLCSSDLCDGECVFTIKVNKISACYNNDSCILVGVMESGYKGEKWQDTQNHCVFLNIPLQLINRPNEEQTKQEVIKCSCQPTLASLPCLIECNFNRNQNTITWHYNGKDQVKSNFPKSWKDRTKICAVVMLFYKYDCVEFI